MPHSFRMSIGGASCSIRTTDTIAACYGCIEVMGRSDCIDQHGFAAVALAEFGEIDAPFATRHRTVRDAKRRNPVPNSPCTNGVNCHQQEGYRY